MFIHCRPVVFFLFTFLSTFFCDGAQAEEFPGSTADLGPATAVLTNELLMISLPLFLCLSLCVCLHLPHVSPSLSLSLSDLSLELTK